MITERTLHAPLTVLRGVGPARAKQYAEIGVIRLLDLLCHGPRRYRSLDPPRPIAELAPGAESTIHAEIQRKRPSGRRGRAAGRLDLRDASGEVTALLFGPRYLLAPFQRGQQILARGELRSLPRPASTRKAVRPLFLVREILREGEWRDPAKVVVPEYALPEGLALRMHRRLLHEALGACREELTRRPLLLPRRTGEREAPRTCFELFGDLHDPPDVATGDRALRQLAFSDLVRLQERLIRLRLQRTRRVRPGLPGVESFRVEYERALPFELTADQREALGEIAADLRSPHAMSRLLCGDVGSGKTVVSLFPLALAARAGRRGVLLAPTEILARQHQESLGPVLQCLGLPPPRLVTGSARLPPAATPGEILIGTHRLLSQQVELPGLAALVVDEQQKFGVRQRFQLWNKGAAPDLLLASATPIPRTLAFALLGHLEQSELRSRPFGPPRIQTEVLVGEARHGLLGRLREELAAGGQVFVVCPAINARPGGRAEGRPPSTEEMTAFLRRHFPPARVETLHGRLDETEKQARLGRFASGEATLLVATVVIEVGIDLPGASMVVIAGAERFGLAQLHQIRGRVGRRGKGAKCLLISREPRAEARQRLDRFAATLDGFELARLDLLTRGPGQLLGLRQHGILDTPLPGLWEDPALLESARELAMARVEHRDVDRKRLSVRQFQREQVASAAWIW